MRKYIIILIQVLTLLAEVALLICVRHPVIYFFSFIMIFSAYDSYMWFYLFKDAYPQNRKSFWTIAYRISQLLVQIFYFVWGALHYGWLAPFTTVITWWLGFCDIVYYWLNRQTFDKEMPWMCNWSVHWVIKKVFVSNGNDYNCPKKLFLLFGWIGLGLGLTIIIFKILLIQ